MRNPYHDDKPVHLAKLMRGDGAVSPLCAKTPRKLNLNVATWTNRREAVTCKRCLAAMAARPEGG